MRSVKEVGYMIQEFYSCINGDALVRKEGGAGCRRRRERKVEKIGQREKRRKR